MSTNFYDEFGWYSTDSKYSDRVADVAPSKIPKKRTVGNIYPNWSGYVWMDLPYTAPQEYIAPPVVVDEPQKKITRLAFLNRFADAEAIALDLASIGATVEAASIRRYLSKVNAASFIDLSEDDTRNGVTALETMGMLASGRALEILDTPIADKEKA